MIFAKSTKALVGFSWIAGAQRQSVERDQKGLFGLRVEISKKNLGEWYFVSYLISA